MNQAKKPTLGSIFKVELFLDIVLMNHVLKIIIL